MADEIVLDGETYISSKQAARISGYAQDYIGQLARSGGIEARRVGGLWYVAANALDSHKGKPKKERVVNTSNTRKDTSAPDTIISFDGRDYISATRASKITGYNRDYLGQLARDGVVLSKLVGKRWYIDRESIVNHKASKDAQLASVQSKSVGIPIHKLREPQQAQDDTYVTMHYSHEDADLMPFQPRSIEKQEKEKVGREIDTEVAIESISDPIPSSEEEVLEKVESPMSTNQNLVPIKVVDIAPFRESLTTEKVDRSTQSVVERKANKIKTFSQKTSRNFLPIQSILIMSLIALVLIPTGVSLYVNGVRFGSFVSIFQTLPQGDIAGLLHRIAESGAFDRLSAIFSQDLVFLRGQ